MKRSFPDGPVTLDASLLINALGCGRSADVLEPFAGTLVEQKTLAEITRHPVSGSSHAIELAALTERCIRVHRMTNEEYEIYMRLVRAESRQALGSGESAAIATAVGQKTAVVLDDAKARRVCREMFPKLAQVSSLTLLAEGALRAKISNAETADLLARAVKEARMRILRDERDIYDGLLRAAKS